MSVHQGHYDVCDGYLKLIEAYADSKTYYTLRQSIVSYWYKIHVQKMSQNESFWMIKLLPNSILTMITLYTPAFTHELFLFDTLQFQQNVLIFNPTKFPKQMFKISGVNPWHLYINTNEKHMTREARVVMDIFISGHCQFMAVFGTKLELNLSYCKNAFITIQSQQFLACVLANGNASNVSFISTDFDDYMMGLFCFCMKWRLDNDLPIIFEELNFSENSLSDASFELFCEFMPFMYELKSVSFSNTMMTVTVMDILRGTLQKMIDHVNQNSDGCTYNLKAVHVSNQSIFFGYDEEVVQFKQFVNENRNAAPFMNILTV